MTKKQILELEHEGKTYVSAFVARQILGISQTIWYRNDVGSAMQQYKFSGTFGRIFYLKDDVLNLKDTK